jgi:signal transduction histidine kinase
MTAPSHEGRFDTWEKRLEILGRVAPFGLLVISVTLAMLSGGGWGSDRITLALAAAAGAWTGWWVSLHPAWAGRTALMRLYYVGFLALATVLIARSPWFAFFAFTGVLHALQLFRGFWRYAGVAASAVLIAIAQTGGVRRATPTEIFTVLVVAVFDAALYLGFGLIGQKAEDQNTRRKQLIAELAESNRKLEETLAEKAGLQAQLLTQAREAGVSAERQRMAREIHDTLAQGLAGIITQLEAAQRAAGGAPGAGPPDGAGTPGQWRRHLDTAARLARHSLAEARRSVSAIRPQVLEDAKLPDAVAEEAARWSAISEVKADVATTGNARPLHPQIEVTLLRTAQEALANVGKHAAASRVALTLSYMEDVVTLDVRDDGRGFTADTARPNGHGGFGLEAMRQRLRDVSGTLAIESEPGGGTALSASVPAIGIRALGG